MLADQADREARRVPAGRNVQERRNIPWSENPMTHRSSR